MIHQGDREGDLHPLISKFAAEGKRLPEIIDAYLQGESMAAEFITASLAAVDALVFVLDQVRGQESTKPKEISSSVKKKSTRPRRVSADVMLLKAFLRHHHDPRETGEKALIPLTADQIAEAMQWLNEDGEPVQSRASRRMLDVFGPDAMNKYKRVFLGDINRFPDCLDDEKS